MPPKHDGKAMIKDEPKDLIWVKYEKVDNAHFFTEPESGLCVGHPDLKTAFEEVSVQLAVLFKVNYKIEGEIKVSPAMEFEQFQAWINATTNGASETFRPRPCSQLAWR
jgi:hypothetical protein